MDDNNVTDIFLWIFSFMIIVAIVFLLFYKIQVVSSNQEFFAEYHSFQLSNIIGSLFLEKNSYFKTPYSLGKLEDVSLHFNKNDPNNNDKNNFLILKLKNIPYKNLLLIPEDSKIENKDNLNNIIVLEKENDNLKFNNLNSCSKIEEKKTIEYYENNPEVLFYNKKKDFENIIIIVSESYNDYCNVFYTLKNQYYKKNVLLIKIPDEQFKSLFDKNIVLFFS